MLFETEKDGLDVPGTSKHRKRKSLSDPQPAQGKLQLQILLLREMQVARLYILLHTET